MKINTNSWNKLRYTLYAPIYDLLVRYFNSSRKKSIDSLEIKEGESVLIVGAGTGLDLEFLPDSCVITATDITPAMVARIKTRNRILKKNVCATVMDGQKLTFPNGTFDYVIAHLILAVIPDSNACISEIQRVLKHGGHVAIFDKFVPKNIKVSMLRKLSNVIANLLFSNITRNLESIVSQTTFKVVSDNDAHFKGNFRRIKLFKP